MSGDPDKFPGLGLLAADARILLKQNAPFRFFNEAVRFDDRDENKIEPTNDVFLKKSIFAKGSKAAHWDVCIKNADGEDEQLLMGGPLCLSSSLFVNQLGNFGKQKDNGPKTEAEAGFWFAINAKSYFSDEENDHVLEFYEWHKRMQLWGFKTTLSDSKFVISWKDRIKDAEKFEGKTPKDWTPADWRTKCDDVAKFAIIKPNKEGVLTVGMEAKVFYEPKAQVGDKRKTIVKHSIPEIAAVEEKYGVRYNQLRIYRFDLKAGLIPLTDQEIWDGKWLRGGTVYWPIFNCDFSDNGKQEVRLKFRLKMLVLMGTGTEPLPDYNGTRPIHFQVNTEDPAVREFLRKQAEAEAMKAFEESV